MIATLRIRALLPLILLALSTACNAAESQTPSKRVLEALALIRDGKQVGLRDYILQGDFKDKDVEEGAQVLYMLLSDAFRQNGGVSGFEIESEQIEGERAYVKFRCHYKNGNSNGDTFPLQREQGKWRIRL